MVDAHVYVVCNFELSLNVDLMYIHILAWASALLVSTDRAMRRPQAVGRVINDSHAFYFEPTLVTGEFGESMK